MKAAVLLLGLPLMAMANPFPQGVTQQISPKSRPPKGCTSTYDGVFGMYTLVKAKSKNQKRSPSDGDLEIATPDQILEERSSASPPTTCRKPGLLMMTLANGVLKDAFSRTGYVASNRQFQFDDPPQSGAIYTAGFSVCPNGDIMLGGQRIWYQCDSGAFSNLYDTNWAPQCVAIEMRVLKVVDC